MKDEIKVEPVPGRSLPLEATPQRRVDRKMAVPNRAYYRRALRRGDIALAKSGKRADKEG